MGPTVVWCLCPASEAERLGQKLVSERLAGIVDVLPSQVSLLAWSADFSQVPLVIFTDDNRLDEVFEAITEALGEEPEVIATIATPDAGDVFCENLEATLERRLQPGEHLTIAPRPQGLDEEEE